MVNVWLVDMFVDVFDKFGMQSGMQNFVMFVMVLLCILLEQFGCVVFVVVDVLYYVGVWQLVQYEYVVFGVCGVYWLLYDEVLWEVLMLLFEGLKVFV